MSNWSSSTPSAYETLEDGLGRRVSQRSAGRRTKRPTGCSRPRPKERLGTGGSPRSVLTGPASRGSARPGGAVFDPRAGPPLPVDFAAFAIRAHLVGGALAIGSAKRRA
jgi:hypothetical protein